MWHPIPKGRLAAIVYSFALLTTGPLTLAAVSVVAATVVCAANADRPEAQNASGKIAKGKAADGKNISKKAVSEIISDEKPSDLLSEREESPPEQESFLSWLYRSMGLRYVAIFLAVTFNAIALMVMIVFGLRQNSVCPPQLAEDFEAKLNKKQYQEAYDLAKKGGSLLAKVLTAGMANLPEGYEEAVEAMQEAGHEQTVRLEQRNGNIALIAQIGPMLGLLATVDGIVRSFAVIASKEVTPKPSELAQGIGIALVNTMVGLSIAVVSIIFYHYARNRLTRLVIETGIVSGRLIKRFSKIKIDPSGNNRK
jgi:biopolymer transport protein ExbB